MRAVLSRKRQTGLDIAGALFGFDAAGGAHHSPEDDLRVGAVAEAVDAKRAGVGELAALAGQPLLDRAGGQERAVDAGEDSFLFEAREQVRQDVRFDLGIGDVGEALGDIDRLAVLAADLAGAVRGIERHGDVVVRRESRTRRGGIPRSCGGSRGRDGCH